MKGELRVRERAYADPVLDTLVELNGTVDQREQRVVLATANVLTRVDVRAVLTVNGALVLILGIVPGGLMSLCADAIVRALAS